MTIPFRFFRWQLGLVVLGGLLSGFAAPPATVTPPPPARPRINGPSVFGVRPGSPVLYSIPATGDRPMVFGVQSLPEGLAFDSASGRITGRLTAPGEYEVTLTARNASGTDRKRFRIVVGDKIALTPPMGWNSWNCWAAGVDQDKVLRSARALAASGLDRHGWTYINIDDGWQGPRSGPGGALEGNEKFPDLGGLCAAIHELGLKAGIYSTPFVTSYAGFPGGSSDNGNGRWSKDLLPPSKGRRFGRFSFAQADARQWARWGFDYLKYDWNPNDVPHVAEMSAALRASGRDLVFSLSNSAPLAEAKEWSRLANSWRTTGDVSDRWTMAGEFWQFGVSEIGFNQDRWVPYGGPGHWNDPDMLVVGQVGWGKLHPTGLTPDEQYAQVSLWCLLSAPLLIGCDLERLDPFTIGLLSNDEVLALDQDALGQPASRVATYGPVDIYLKNLEDGARALGFFNRDSTEQVIVFNKLSFLGFHRPQHVRDLWRQQNLRDLATPVNRAVGGPVIEPLKMTLPPHGVMLLKLWPAG